MSIISKEKTINYTSESKRLWMQIEQVTTKGTTTYALYMRDGDLPLVLLASFKNMDELRGFVSQLESLITTIDLETKPLDVNITYVTDYNQPKR